MVTNPLRIVAIVCIAVIVVIAITPAATQLLSGILARIDPLFGSVRVTGVKPAETSPLATAPFLSLLASRAPPLV